MILTFGKHAGKDSMDLPLSYLEWGSLNLQSAMWRKEFNRVLDLRTSNDPLMRKAQIANSECPETEVMDFYREYQAEEENEKKQDEIYFGQIELTVDKLIGTGLFGNDRVKLRRAIASPGEVVFTSPQKEEAFWQAMDYLVSLPSH